MIYVNKRWKNNNFWFSSTRHFHSVQTHALIYKYSGTCLLRHSRKCVGLYRMSENSDVRSSTVLIFSFVSCCSYKSCIYPPSPSTCLHSHWEKVGISLTCLTLYIVLCQDLHFYQLLSISFIFVFWTVVSVAVSDISITTT